MTDLLTRPETGPDRASRATSAPSRAHEAQQAPQAWARLLLALTARTLLVVITSMALWGALPALIGWKPTTVVTGSMEPRISIGDIAVAMPAGADGPALGHVILFDDPDHQGLLRLHRLVSIDEQGLLVTRGDANDADDSSHVDPGSVHGIGVLKVPWIGTPIVWFHEGRYLQVLGAIVALAGLMALSGLDRDLRRPRAEGEDPQRGAGGGRRRDASEGAVARRSDGALPRRSTLGLGHVARRARGLLLVPVVVLGLVASSAAPAWAAWSGVTSNPTSAFGAATYYTCDSAPTADRPYLYWKLDEATGSSVAADASGNDRTGTYLNGVTRTEAACGRGSAITLNGTDQYVATTSQTAVAGPDTFSIETWFRTGRGGVIATFGGSRTGTAGQHDRHVYMTEAGRLYFGVYDGALKTVSSGPGYADGRWHHVVATLSSNGMVLYLDGTQVAQDTTTTRAERYDGYWRLGYNALGNWPDRPVSNYFAGSLDNAAIYTTALTTTQVADHYNSR